jgi:hypothetical protein
MTERKVTEKQISLAIDKHLINCGPLKHKNDLLQYRHFIDELFPELPKVGELILCWDKNEPDQKNWCYFVGISNDGRAIAIDHEGDEEPCDNYRRQTPAERGEG